jgi:hypothetical protein
MRATLVHDGADPVDFVVRDDRGTTVQAGRSTPGPVRPEPTSGTAVQVLDSTGLAVERDGCRIEAAGQVSHPFAVRRRLYAPLAADAPR